jgi:hypothetical protein
VTFPGPVPVAFRASMEPPCHLYSHLKVPSPPMDHQASYPLFHPACWFPAQSTYDAIIFFHHPPAC